VFECTNNPGSFFGAVVSYNSSDPGWNVRRKDGTVFYFPNGSALTSITDRYQNSITITRNSSGNPTEITDSNGRYINLYYTDSNNPDQITQAVDNPGRTVNYTYTSKSQMASVQDADGNTTQFTWATTPDMATVIYPIDNLTGTITFNGVHRVTGTGGAFGDWTYAYPSGMQGNGIASWCQITNPNSVLRQVYFDNNGYVTEDIQADGLPEQQTTQYARASGTELVTSVTDQLGRVTAYVYDSLSNIISITRLSGTSQAVTTSYTYDPNFSQVTSVTDPLEHKTTVTIDGSGNATARIDPLGNTTTATYNAQGQIKSITDPLKNAPTEFVYDASQDLSTITDPLQNTFTLGYDSEGRTISFEDAYQNTSHFEYDNLNRLINLKDANGAVTEFFFDYAGNLILVIDANQHQMQYNWNYTTNTLQQCDGADRCETFNVDPLGNVISMVDGRGLTSAFTYDGLNRLTEAQYNTSNRQGYNQTRTAYTYDGGNRLMSAQDGQGTSLVIDTVSATYDGLDDLLTASYASSALNDTVTYTYDNDQNRLTMTAANQAQTSYGYDKDNHLTSESRGTQSVGIEYDSDGRYTAITLPNGVTVNYNLYDADSHPTSITYSSTGGGTLGNLTYGYDNDGRVNSLGGSLAAVNMPSAMPTATYDNGNQLAAWNGTAATTDNNGNLLSDPSLNATYTWNERNQLSSASVGGVASTFTYDAIGRRVAQTAGSLTTKYVYDLLNVAQQQFSTGGVGDMLPGLGIDQNFARVDSSGTSAVLPDVLGSTLGLVNSSGAIGTGYGYGPFGQVTTSGASSTNPFQYTGREMDSTGLYFMRARYYNPVLQRFISQDPLGLSGGQVNFYAYVGNSPLNWTDPLGLLGGPVTGGPKPGSPAAGCGDEGSVCVGGFTIGQTPTSGYDQFAVRVKKFIHPDGNADSPSSHPLCHPDSTNSR
jgi:RHS repeat-associated protein